MLSFLLDTMNFDDGEKPEESGQDGGIDQVGDVMLIDDDPSFGLWDTPCPLYPDTDFEYLLPKDEQFDDRDDMSNFNSGFMKQEIKTEYESLMICETPFNISVPATTVETLAVNEVEFEFPEIRTGTFDAISSPMFFCLDAEDSPYDPTRSNLDAQDDPYDLNLIPDPNGYSCGHNMSTEKYLINEDYEQKPYLCEDSPFAFLSPDQCSMQDSSPYQWSADVTKVCGSMAVSEPSVDDHIFTSIASLESCASNFPSSKYSDDDSDCFLIEDFSSLAPCLNPNDTDIKPPCAVQPNSDKDDSESIGEVQQVLIAVENLHQHKAEANLPDGVLVMPLMKHQRIALSWMSEREKSDQSCCGGILADDQGLGKTISTISLIQKEKPPSLVDSQLLSLGDDDEMTADEKKPQGLLRKPGGGTLVVCPPSVLRQWAEEIKTKVTNEARLSVLVYHGSNRTRDPQELTKYDVVLTTYAIVSMEVPKQPLVDEETGDASGRKKKSVASGSKKEKKKKSASVTFVAGPLSMVEWFRVVLDEAQTIKNREPKVTRACWGIRAKRRWCLSGTPIQNKIDDLFSYFRFLGYHPYDNIHRFRDIIESIRKNPTEGYRNLRDALNIVLLRRTKATLLDGEPILTLPPKTIVLKKLDFTHEERCFYDRLEKDSCAQFKEYADAGTVKQNYCNILVLLLRLRQACCHPRLIRSAFSYTVEKGSVQSASNEYQIPDLNLALCDAICNICNDPAEDPVTSVCGHLFCRECLSGYLNGDDDHCPYPECKKILDGELTQIAHTQSDAKDTDCSGSSKISAALAYLRSLSRPSDEPNEGSSSQLRAGEKALVFSQWTGMLDLLEEGLNGSSIQYRRLDGTMSIASKDMAVKDFNTLPEVSVILMSLKAASLGLNMVAACHVILLDLWWNPTTEDQAIDRAHRIGQTRPVNVIRLTIKGTVEDRILQLQEKKRKMVAAVFGDDGGDGRHNHLTEAELKYLFCCSLSL